MSCIITGTFHSHSHVEKPPQQISESNSGRVDQYQYLGRGRGQPVQSQYGYRYHDQYQGLRQRHHLEHYQGYNSSSAPSWRGRGRGWGRGRGKRYNFDDGSNGLTNDQARYPGHGHGRGIHAAAQEVKNSQYDKIDRPDNLRPSEEVQMEKDKWVPVLSKIENFALGEDSVAWDYAIGAASKLKADWDSKGTIYSDGKSKPTLYLNI